MQNVILQIDPLLKIKMLDYYILCQTCWRKCVLGVQLHDIVIASNKRNVFRFRDFCRHLHKFQAINRSWLCTICSSIQYSRKRDLKLLRQWKYEDILQWIKPFNTKYVANGDKKLYKKVICEMTCAAHLSLNR